MDFVVALVLALEQHGLDESTERLLRETISLPPACRGCKDRPPICPSCQRLAAREEHTHDPRTEH